MDNMVKGTLTEGTIDAKGLFQQHLLTLSSVWCTNSGAETSVHNASASGAWGLNDRPLPFEFETLV